MGFEPTTFSLARRRTTTVLRPHFWSQILTESAETQDRTGDTAIFSRVLYQLSYLGQIPYLLSVRDFTRGYRDCQARVTSPAEQAGAEEGSLDLYLLPHYNARLLVRQMPHGAL